jgi:hypothetical protein
MRGVRDPLLKPLCGDAEFEQIPGDLRNGWLAAKARSGSHTQLP